MKHWTLVAAVIIAMAEVTALADQTSPPPNAVPAFASVTPALISQDALLERQASNDQSFFLLDVRTPAEFAAGHVPGAVNIPYDQVASRLQDIPKDKEVILYCKSGRRAGVAAERLAASGYAKLGHLDGDMQGWQAAGRPVEAAAPKPAEAK